MSVVPHELLACAQVIHRATVDEATRRALISRGYYAAYHAAYAFHVSLPIPGSVSNAKGKHEQLVAQLQHPAVKSSDPLNFASRKIGIILGNLLGARIKADYYLLEEVTTAEADSTLFQVQDVFRLCYPEKSAEHS